MSRRSGPDARFDQVTNRIAVGYSVGHPRPDAQCAFHTSLQGARLLETSAVVDDTLLDDAAHPRTWRSASFRFLEDDLDLAQSVTEGLGLKDEPKSLLVRVGEQLVAVHRIAFRPQQPRARVEAYDMRWNLRPASQARTVAPAPTRKI